MNIAVLSNINLEPLKSFLPKGDHYFCGYGRYLEELIDDNSEFNGRVFDSVLIHLEGSELLKGLSGGLIDPSQAKSTADDLLNPLLESLQRRAARNPQTVFVVTTAVSAPFSFLNYLDVNSVHSLRRIEEYINARLIDFAVASGSVRILDWNRITAWHGYKDLVDEKFWYLGRIKYTNKAHKALAAEFNNIFRAVRGKTGKVLVLDLDNTLWGGVIGEDGVGGIELSEDGLGKAYRDFQSAVKSLTSLGVILAVNSKNNSGDAEEAFLHHPMMILRLEDFSARRINWRSKVDNMREIAEELNLGLDSFVFIDDDPRERALVCEHLPEVCVPDFPADAAQLKTWFLNDVVYAQFPKVFVTAEDVNKAAQYKARAQRLESSRDSDIRDSASHLNMELQVFVDDRRFLRRTAQLTQKTNQFNMTTRRYQESEIEAFFAQPDTSVFQCDYRDKFGQEGVVGVAVVRIDGTCAHVDTFLMSCRVIGKTAEYAFFYRMLCDLKTRGVERITAEFRSTVKNSVARDFYAKAGLSLTKIEGDISLWEADVTVLMRSLERTYGVENVSAGKDKI